MKREYDFQYTFYIPLKSGRKFKRTGTMKGYSASDVKSKILEKNPGVNADVTPIIKGLSGADAVFYNNYNRIEKTDKPN